MDFEHYIALGADFIDMGDFLEHHGVKGMKWGVRKETYKSYDRKTRTKQRIVSRMAKKQKKPWEFDKSRAFKWVATHNGWPIIPGAVRLENIAQWQSKRAFNWNQVHKQKDYKESVARGKEFLDKLEIYDTVYDYKYRHQKDRSL